MMWISMKKCIVLLLVLVLVAFGIVTFLPVKAEPRTITVPDDYSTIQAAIDHANVGDTVFVKRGTYYVYSSIVIDKPLSLMGEDPDNTIIDSQPIPYGGSALSVAASNVTISGFTVTNSGGIAEGGTAIVLQSPRSYVFNCQIIGNKIMNSHEGIWVEAGDKFVIKNNQISTTANGIYLYPRALNGIISENTFTANGLGQGKGSAIVLFGTDNMTIDNNSFSDGHNGITLNFSNATYVYGNNIADNQGYGIGFDIGCNNATIYGNNIVRNGVGITLASFNPGGVTITPGNVVFRNNLTDNSQQALVSNGTTDIVAWDSGSIGNYWSDYLTKYPNASEIDNSGIGDIPYVIDTENKDGYPLMEPWIATSPITRDSIPTVTFEPIPTATPTPAPTAAPTPTTNPTSTPSPSSIPQETEPPPEPFPTTLVAAASVATVVVVGAGLLVYFKKREW
jgi:parallel beta-helix repeat protein